MIGYTYNGKIINKNDKFYFYDISSGKVILMSNKIAEFLIACKRLSFSKMLEKKYYSTNELRELCIKCKPLLMEKIIYTNEQEDINNFTFDFYNINFIFDLHIKFEDNLENIQKQKANFENIVDFMNENSYKAKVIHITLTGENKLVLEYALKNLRELFNKQKVFFTINSNEKFRYIDKYIFCLDNKIKYEYFKENKEFMNIEKYLNYWYYNTPIELRSNNTIIGDKLIEKFEPFIRELREYPVKYKEMCKIFISLKKGEKRIFNCSGGINSLYFNFSTGEFKPCNKSDEVIGNLETGINKESRSFYLKNSIFNKHNCKNCWAKYICSGGCTLSSTKSCDNYKGILENIIIIYYYITQRYPEILESIQEEIEIVRHPCTLSPISEKCIINKS
ncbi:SPASM domain-containing protein [Clostridium sp. BL-8]|uniref:SPASM domain-containing protein n=1 Tax=Clostridium sp. BL-8 TaxID=349938 RepID=UPI00098C37AB|nr:SPASM domain-containing protein [Clostridium sp. BL-8]OOM77112.1 hypothetical protein CLOBL_31150 [Clostridium sp. BL-8]